MKRTGRSKTRTAKGITACKRRRRCLSFKSRAATTVEQREGHHGSLYGSPTSMRASQAVDWNVTQARNSNASQGHHTRRLALDPCVTTMSHVQRARSTSSSPYYVVVWMATDLGPIGHASISGSGCPCQQQQQPDGHASAWTDKPSVWRPDFAGYPDVERDISIRRYPAQKRDIPKR